MALIMRTFRVGDSFFTHSLDTRNDVLYLRESESGETMLEFGPSLFVSDQHGVIGEMRLERRDGVDLWTFVDEKTKEVIYLCAELFDAEVMVSKRYIDGFGPAKLKEAA